MGRRIEPPVPFVRHYIGTVYNNLDAAVGTIYFSEVYKCYVFSSGYSGAVMAEDTLIMIKDAISELNRREKTNG